MLQLDLRQGAARDFQLQINDSTGAPATGIYSSSTDVLTTYVWRGQDTVPLLTGGPSTPPETTWINAALGTYQITFDNVDTASMEIGQYRIQTTVTRAGRTAVVLEALFNLTIAPGLRAQRFAYGPYSDMVKYAKWIQDLQDPNDIEGFADQRADATDWLIRCLIDNWRGANIGFFESHSTAAFAWGWSGPRRSIVPSRWLQDALLGVGQYNGLTNGGVIGVGPLAGQQLTPLTTGALILRPNVLRVVAFKAISEVCIGYIAKGGYYSDFGAMFRSAADSEAINCRFELDVNRDGLAEFAIPFSAVNTLYT